ncbi:MAG: hypothetical protein ACLQU2_11200 [Candidatus Binataceae bacterium]
MAFNGVELLKLQFSRAIDQTFEHFLDSWSMPPAEESSGPSGHFNVDQSPVEIPVNISA